MLGTKGKMSQAFVEGTRVPMTLIKVGPCVVTQVKSQAKDGYWAVQLGFSTKKIKRDRISRYDTNGRKPGG